MPGRFIFGIGPVLLAVLVLAGMGGAWVPAVRAESPTQGYPEHALSGPRAPAEPAMIALGVYRPSFPDDLAAAEEYERAAGAGLRLIHWYALWGGWKGAFSRADLAAVGRRGSTPLITWEPWAGRADDPAWSLREAILSGRQDAYIESWARGLAAYGRPVLLRFAHEMHHQSYPWAVGVNGNTAEEYVAAWRHVHEIFARLGATNVAWIWNPNTLGGAPPEAYEPVYRSLYPGDAYVDWVGLDIYNTGPGLDWGAPSWRSFAEILDPPYRAVTALTARPLLLPEMGCAETGGSKAAWIADALTVQLPSRFPRVRAAVWFDTDKEERWALHSSDQVLSAWTAAAGRVLAGS
jgi:beta-mannanase